MERTEQIVSRVVGRDKRDRGRERRARIRACRGDEPDAGDTQAAETELELKDGQGLVDQSRVKRKDERIGQHCLLISFGGKTVLFPHYAQDVDEIVQSICSVPQFMLPPVSGAYRRKDQFFRVYVLGSGSVSGRSSAPPSSKKPLQVYAVS